MDVVVSPALRLRKLTIVDNPAIARVVRRVPTEYGLTADKDYTVASPSLGELHRVYNQPDRAYWVVEYEDEMVGSGGIAPLAESESNICGLQKIYFLPAIRDKGPTKKPALMTVEQTREMDFKCCCLETAAFLKGTIALYEHLGFEHIDYVLGCTGHTGCEVRMLHKLRRMPTSLDSRAFEH